MTKSIKQIIPLTLALFVLVSYQFIGAAWTNPPADPPHGNVPAPVNVGSAAQAKNGPLGVDGLAVFGNQVIQSQSPTIRWSDYSSGNNDWWTHVNDNNFYFLFDRNTDGAWNNDDPWPLELHGMTNSANDFALFSNQVRANEYCDRNGGNCITPGADTDKGAINIIEQTCQNDRGGKTRRCTIKCPSDRVVVNCWWDDLGTYYVGGVQMLDAQTCAVGQTYNDEGQGERLRGTALCALVQ